MLRSAVKSRERGHHLLLVPRMSLKRQRNGWRPAIISTSQGEVIAGSVLTTGPESSEVDLAHAGRLSLYSANAGSKTTPCDLGSSVHQRAGETCMPANPLGIRGIRVEGFDLHLVEFIQSARANAVCSVPSICLDAAEPVGLATARSVGRSC